jgi:pyruvate,water dikinase
MVLVTGSWGLGENIVQGKVDPDEFYVHKPTFRLGYRAVLSRSLGDKELRLVYARGKGDASTRNVPTSRSERERFCLSEAEVLQLADYSIRIEDHYSKLTGGPTPMDIEWARMVRTASSTLSRPALKRLPGAGRWALGAFETHMLKASAQCWRRAARLARRSLPARFG